MNNQIKFTLQNIIILILFVYFAHSFGSQPFPGDNMTVINNPNSTHPGYGFLSMMYTIFCFLLFVGIIIFTCVILLDDNAERIKEEKCGKFLIFKKIINMKLKVWAITILLTLLYIGYSTTGKLSSIYNQSVVYNKQYDQKVIERLGFYDKLWKTFLAKEKITNLDKETFIEVATIQMENRRDGQAVTWKWVQENSPIPYDQFTAFYADLSNFIETQRDQYYALETQCQDIATAHNMLIDTFPNNIYNKLLQRKRTTVIKH